MTKENDLAVSVVRWYSWEQLRPYAVSLAKSGFSGTKLMFVEGITVEARENLTRLGFHIVDVVVRQLQGYRLDQGKDNRHEGQAFMNARFSPVIDYLGDHHDMRYVIWSDARDVVFQSDPSLWLENRCAPANILGAGECWLIKNALLNNTWMRQACDGQSYSWIRDHEVCCCGTLAGDAWAMRLLFVEMRRMMMAAPSMIVDQAALNYVLRIPPFKDIVRIPRMKEGFAATAGVFFLDRRVYDEDCKEYVDVQLIDSHPRFDEEFSLVRAPETDVPFAIVHQYDRSPAWTRIMNERYKE
jgi:hypothetical protein